MPDLTMCSDSDCPSCDICYRFTAIPWKLGQSYFLGSPRNPSAEKCEYFMMALSGGENDENTGS